MFTEYSAVIIFKTVPEIAVLSILKRWRENRINVPVLVITEPVGVSTRGNILNTGTDGCIQKPAEIIARLGSIIRRIHAVTATVLQHDDITLDICSRVVKKQGVSVSLTTREMAVLELFLLCRHRVLSRRYLDEQLGAWNREVGSNIIQVHISNLRRKLGKEFIGTVHGQGYRLRKNNAD